MAIIYSYPTEANPALSDLLIGTDVGTKGNPTKSFTIGKKYDWKPDENPPVGGYDLDSGLN